MNIPDIAFNTNFVSSLTGVSVNKLNYWDRTGLIKPSILKAEGRGTIRLYSFEDLVEIKTVVFLLKTGIKLPQIRLAVDYIRNELDLSRPLKDKQLISNGKEILCTTENINNAFYKWVSASQYGQIVMPFVIPLDAITSDIRDKVTEITSRVEKGRKQQKEGKTISWDSVRDDYVSDKPNKRSCGRSRKAS
jgi:DNA-binding transcriptional MerR regulator